MAMRIIDIAALCAADSLTPQEQRNKRIVLDFLKVGSSLTVFNAQDANWAASYVYHIDHPLLVPVPSINKLGPRFAGPVPPRHLFPGLFYGSTQAPARAGKLDYRLFFKFGCDEELADLWQFFPGYERDRCAVPGCTGHTYVAQPRNKVDPTLLAEVRLKCMCSKCRVAKRNRYLKPGSPFRQTPNVSRQAISDAFLAGLAKCNTWAGLKVCLRNDGGAGARFVADKWLAGKRCANHQILDHASAGGQKVVLFIRQHSAENAASVARLLSGNVVAVVLVGGHTAKGDTFVACYSLQCQPKNWTLPTFVSFAN